MDLFKSRIRKWPYEIRKETLPTRHRRRRDSEEEMNYFIAIAKTMKGLNA
jgi:hypothetical protein